MKPKHKRGRPVSRTMPDPIPDTPESIALAIMQGPSKDEWRYLAGRGKSPCEGVV